MNAGVARESTSQRVAGVLVAGGLGTRFGGGEPKQFALLGGVPLLVHAGRVFDAAAAIDGWVAVAPAGLEARTRAILEAGGAAQRLRDVVTGGATRQESVWNGLRAAGGAGIVVVHDAARPFVSARLLAETVAAATAAGAATVATPVSDTLLRVESSDVVSSAAGEVAVVVSGTRVDRDRLWSVQTPQAFRVEVLRAAHERALADATAGVATDDSQLVLAQGGRVALVPGAWWNLKVTAPEDLARAALLLSVLDSGVRGR
jgi:2-C-methyl-D-erythritol 4-phosphate cytidylyltransferase/2-C-methyl-D-erythritol 2,4-cyclodiphosphate synthase